MKTYIFTRTNLHLRSVMAELAAHPVPEIWQFYGASGAGKTTLIRSSLEDLPEGSVTWSSGERILEDILKDLRIGARSADFDPEQRYPGEILVIEDIECWKGKEQTMRRIGEMLRTLNEGGKTIVLTSIGLLGWEELGIAPNRIFVPMIPVDRVSLPLLCREYDFDPTPVQLAALRRIDRFYEAEGLVKYYRFRHSMQV